ncbi:MAG: type II secretion system protein [Planctomycetaceae bacterium]|nr:type II secretion system protein [Planctomycetaceae bacterium]
MNRTLPTSEPRYGFTLIEMLVATALVVLIMLMFATIYGSAIGTITEQRGLANNDQKARIVTNVIRNDLWNMTYRQAQFPYGTAQGIVPLAPGDSVIADPENQRGYFYYSENNFNNDGDDVLQFTAQIGIGQRGDAPSRSNQLPFVGRTADLGVSNEPEDDDGQSNGQGQSRAAEISYFLRNGKLYRRVLLIRDPLRQSRVLPDQPSNGNGVLYFGTGTTASSADHADFYDDFDYSASRRNDDGGTSYLWFHSIQSLNNNIGVKNFPLAIPNVRFGHAVTTGQPVEFDSNSVFFGRFTHQETSDSDFSFPGEDTNNPYTRTDLEDTDSDGDIDVFEDGSRISEDQLLANVEAFNIEVWDPGANQYVSLGDSSSVRFADSERTNTTYGPNPGSNRVFDTWHPSVSISGDPDPPFRPRLSQLNGWTVVDWATANTSGNDYVLPSTLSNRSQALVFALVSDDGTGKGPIEPEWPLTPGAQVRDGGIVWECVDNRIGLKSIRIIIRYRDVGSHLPRQVTIVHSFVE